MLTAQARADVTDQIAEPIPAAFQKSIEGIVVTHLVENGECGSPRSKTLETRDTATTSQNGIQPVMTRTKTLAGRPTPSSVIDLT